MTRWGLRGSLALGLLLIPVPGAFARTCTAVSASSGLWTATSTWSCGTGANVPASTDNVVIPAGRSVQIASGDDEQAAGLTLNGALALGDANSSLEATGLSAAGGTLSGPLNATVTVSLDPAVVASIAGTGLTVNGAYLDVSGSGALSVAAPLAIVNGGWLESDVGTTWTGTAPWTLGGADGSLTSGFEVVGSQLTISGATAAQTAPGAGDGVIQLDGGATLSKQDASTTTLDVDVLLDDSVVQVIAGKLIGGLQGDAALSLSAGAVLGLSGTSLELSSDAVNVTGGSVEIEPGADIALDLPSNPGLKLLSIGAGASLDAGIDSGSGPVDADGNAPAEMLADTTTLGAGAALSLDGGGGTLTLAGGDVLAGGGTLDASLENTGGTVAPAGALHVTGDYAQAAAGSLALDLRSASDGDSLAVDGSVALGGALKVDTGYAPGASAAPLVLSAAAKPDGMFAKVTAPVSGGRAWTAAYGDKGVTLGLGAAGSSSAAVAGSLARPAIRPAKLVVGATARCSTGSDKLPAGAAYQWLRDGKAIAGATKARYLLVNRDAGHAIACRVTGAHGGSAATSPAQRPLMGLSIAAASEHDGHDVTVMLHCAARELTCHGSLRVLLDGHAVAGGAFALRAPGGSVRLRRLGSALISSGQAVVRANYRNRAGAARRIARRVELAA